MQTKSEDAKNAFNSNQAQDSLFDQTSSSFFFGLIDIAM
jgi:hypothetical protein